MAPVYNNIEVNSQDWLRYIQERCLVSQLLRLHKPLNEDGKEFNNNSPLIHNNNNNNNSHTDSYTNSQSGSHTNSQNGSHTNSESSGLDINVIEYFTIPRSLLELTNKLITHHTFREYLYDFTHYLSFDSSNFENFFTKWVPILFNYSPSNDINLEAKESLEIEVKKQIAQILYYLFVSDTNSFHEISLICHQLFTDCSDSELSWLRIIQYLKSKSPNSILYDDYSHAEPLWCPNFVIDLLPKGVDHRPTSLIYQRYGLSLLKESYKTILAVETSHPIYSKRA